MGRNNLKKKKLNQRLNFVAKLSSKVTITKLRFNKTLSPMTCLLYLFLLEYAFLEQ